jgi:hypothetical protein
LVEEFEKYQNWFHQSLVIGNIHIITPKDFWDMWSISEGRGDWEVVGVERLLT